MSADDLAGGSIEFTIGNQKISGKIDELKNYSVTLDTAALNMELPFYAVATGGAGQTWAELASYLPSINALKKLAGSDALLEAREYAGVNLTYLSTAEFAEIINSRIPVNTDSDRKNAILNLEPGKTLEQAAMLSRLMNDADVHLPTFTTTSLSYLLNTSLADAHLEILRIKNKPVLTSEIEKIKNDPQQSLVSATPMLGTYLLETKTAQYLIHLSSDGTGTFNAGHMDSDLNRVQASGVIDEPIKWSRKGTTITIEFANTVSYPLYYLDIAADDTNYYCNDPATPAFDVCNISIKSLQLKLISQAEFRTYGDAQLNIELTRSTDSALIYRGALRSSTARLVNLETSPQISATALAGFEWIAKKYSYVFANNGLVTRTNLLTNDKKTLNWQLTNNRILLDDDSELRIVSEEVSGLGVISIESTDLYRTSLVKRAALIMQPGWWMGRWTTYRRGSPSSSYDVNPDGTWHDGFESGLKGSWVRLDDRRQKAISNGSWRMIRDVLGLYEGKYYLSVCQGVEAEPFVPYDCYLSVENVNRDFLGGVFWNDWSNPFFNQTLTGGVWSLLANTVYSSAVPEGLITSRSVVKVSDHMLYNRSTDTVIELTDATKNQISVCEYKATESCAEGITQRYERGVEVGLTVSAGGTVAREFSALNPETVTTQTKSSVVDKVIMLPKKRSMALVLSPALGYSVKESSASGCNGVLSGNVYTLPALTENCNVTINFIKNP